MPPLQQPWLTNERFSYNRNFPPNFIVHSPRKQCVDSEKLAREYFRLGQKVGSSHLTVMSNGMSLGEYAMQVCVDRNRRRNCR